MRLAICFIIGALALPYSQVFAQGNLQVLEVVDKQPIYHVLVTNKRTRADTYTDEQGHFTLSINRGDTLLLSHPSYTFTTQRVFSETQVIYMSAIVHKLGEVQVRSDMLKYREDSAFEHSVYHKVLKDAKFKTKVYPGPGAIIFDGIFTSTAYLVSGKGRKNKKFANQLAIDDKQRFINVRYSKGVVESTTKLSGDSTQLFIDRYPMNYEFARSASDLEVKMWIRGNYNRWLQR